MGLAYLTLGLDDLVGLEGLAPVLPKGWGWGEGWGLGWG